MSLFSVFLLLLATLLCFFADHYYWADWISSLRWYLGLLCLGVAGLHLAMVRLPAAVLALALAGLHMGPALMLGVGKPEVPAQGIELKVATVNLFVGNYKAELFKNWLDQEQPHVIAVLENSAFWQVVLDRCAQSYPYQVMTVARPPAWNNRPWKMGLLSRYPIEEHRFHRLNDQSIPWLEATLRVGEHKVKVAVLHAMTSRTQGGMGDRNEIFEQVAETLGRNPPVIVLGDFNATLYSPAFQRFIQDTGLKDTRHGFGRQPTWIPFLSLPFPILDLDHILVSPEMGVSCRTCGPAIGSDHLPVTATLRLSHGQDKR